MKTKEEIKEMIEKCKKLRKGMPQFSIFGDDNWKNLDRQIEALGNCLKLDESEITAKEEIQLDAMDELGQAWDDDPQIQIYDWVLEKAEDDPVTDEDIEVFCKETKK